MRLSASASSATRAYCASLEIPTLRAPSVAAFLAARRAHPESPLLVTGALDAWALGVDSYNSYFTVVNPRIVPKVGEQFAPVRA